MILIPERLKTTAFTQVTENGKYIKITWLAHLRAYAIYSALYGTDQTAERLAERGGFGEEELDSFYPEWRNHIVK